VAKDPRRLTSSRPHHKASRWQRLKNVPKRTWAIITGMGVLIGVALGVTQLGGVLESTLETPIRVDYRYVSVPRTEGVVLKDFEPQKDPSFYLEQEGQIAYSHPSVIFDVVGQAGSENVKVAPYVVVKVNEIKPMPERVDYVAYRFPGGGVGSIKVFAATFSPERTGVFYAPQATADAVPGTSDAPYVRKPADYFTLAAGELEVFQLAIFMVPGY
jgi:hypothetical protein